MKHINLTYSFIISSTVVLISALFAHFTFGFQNLLERKESLFIIDDILYPIMLLCMLFFAKTFISTKKTTDYFIFLFLGIMAYFRELGAQKWLTTTDTSVTKIRFFTNSNNPISERLVAGIILLTIFAAIIYLIIKYAPKIIKGIFNLTPLYWNIATFVGLGVLSKILDRFPGKYRKSTGTALSEEARTYFLFFEESIEFSLPILVVFLMWQYCFFNKKKPA